MLLDSQIALLIGILVLLLGGLIAVKFVKTESRAISNILPSDSFQILVQGWQETELKNILDEFAKLYACGTGAIEPFDTTTYLVTIPDGLEEVHLVYLVNYLNYPVGFDLAGKNLAVLAKIDHADRVGIESRELLMVYAPDKDSDFDLVMGRVAGGDAYVCDFGRCEWKAVSDARWPHKLDSLVR